MKQIEVVVGAQYGSEAKGHVTQQLVQRAVSHDGPVRGPVVNVRVAGPNAGHTAYDAEGRRYALRQIPVGAVSPEPVVLVIASGSEIDPGVLLEELSILIADGHLKNKSLWISPHATLIDDSHKVEETGRLLVQRLGSTAKGIGAARSARLMRDAKRLIDDKDLCKWLREVNGVEVDDYFPYHVGHRDHVIIEGTQGYGLGLHGMYYPQCTSSDCRAIDFMAMAGISPWGERVDVWAVARMFPIRVAGNSGYLMDETTWEELGLPEEKTTVTQKVRRVGQWDNVLVREAVFANGGPAHVRLALTMTDQKWPDLSGIRSSTMIRYDHELWSWTSRVQENTGSRVSFVGTGPQSGFFL